MRGKHPVGTVRFMKIFRALAATLALLFCVATTLTACGAGVDDTSASADSLDSARKKRNHCSTDKNCHNGQVCKSGACTPPPPPNGGCTNSDDCRNGGLCDNGSCTASACNNRGPGKTGIRASVQITRYQGLISGRNGSHEVAFGTLTNVLWIHDAATKDTNKVQLALNVASSIDPAGLPHEIPFTVGQTVEVEGEYISGASAGSSGVAVIHFTHSGCGFVDVNGQQYR